MGRYKTVILPQQKERLQQMGNQIQLARLRRNLHIKTVAERAGVSQQSVTSVEKGNPSVAIGIYANVLMAIGMPDEILHLAKDAILDRTMKELEIKIPKRAPKKSQHELRDEHPALDV